MSDKRPCPFCKGRGRVFPRDLNVKVWPDGLTCDNCSATGDYDTMRLVRAYRLGRAHEHAVLSARVLGVECSERALIFETIEAAVVDDMRRQRYEEALEPGGETRKRLEAKVGQLLRERAPLLTSLNALAVELRAEMARG